MTTVKTLQPPGWPRPKGYANGVSARGRTIFVAGMIGWDAQQRFPAADLAGQARQALANIRAVLAEDGAGPKTINPAVVTVMTSTASRSLRSNALRCCSTAQVPSTVPTPSVAQSTSS